MLLKCMLAIRTERRIIRDILVLSKACASPVAYATLSIVFTKQSWTDLPLHYREHDDQ